jgi:hypothetical protein
MKAKAGTSKERTARRLDWEYPEGMRLVGEYWLQGVDPNCISVVETDSVATMMQAIADWDDLFDISVFPAVTAEEGMQLARGMMQAGA